MMGLGLLFPGIQFMGDATRPLRTCKPFIDAIQSAASPIFGIVAGAVFTAIVQSLAATLGIIIALASQGLIPGGGDRSRSRSQCGNLRSRAVGFDSQTP